MTKILLLIFGYIISITSVSAYTLVSPLEGYLAYEWTNGVDVLAKFIAYAISIAGILWVIGITWGWLQMVLSTGDDEKLKKWRYTVIYSLIGVIVAGMAYGIVTLILNIKIS